MPNPSCSCELPSRRHWLVIGGWLVASASCLVGCSTPPPQPVAHTPRPAPPRHPISAAQSLREYRTDVARHLYAQNQARIYPGKLPPMLYAIGVTRLTISPAGDVLDIDWMRQPKHAPEVVAEIERTIRAGAPYPVAPQLGTLLYTETWLWHKSGRFQLDTLTEGQA